MGAVNNEQLTDALAAQVTSGGDKLLGEILIDLDWASAEKIRRAVELQGATVVRTE